MTNARYLVSRNAREGGYTGRCRFEKRHRRNSAFATHEFKNGKWVRRANYD